MLANVLCACVLLLLLSTLTQLAPIWTHTNIMNSDNRRFNFYFERKIKLSFNNNYSNNSRSSCTGIVDFIFSTRCTCHSRHFEEEEKNQILIELALERRHEHMKNENKLCNDTPMAAKSYECEHCLAEAEMSEKKTDNICRDFFSPFVRSFCIVVRFTGWMRSVMMLFSHYNKFTYFVSYLLNETNEKNGIWQQCQSKHDVQNVPSNCCVDAHRTKSYVICTAIIVYGNVRFVFICSFGSLWWAEIADKNIVWNGIDRL